ncbi:MAG: DAK2 domain-containing protein [Acidimicrobiales bacterium]
MIVLAPARLVRALTAAASTLEASADELNLLDGYAGDGDLGITMSEASRALKEVLAANEGMGAAQLLTACGATIARRAPSTSGTLVASGFLRAAKEVADIAGSDVGVLERAFAAATAGIQARGKATVGDRTLVDGLDAVCTSLRESLGAGRELGDALHFAALAASATADKTVDMEPKVGRASWVPQRAAGHPDAGCAMLAIVLRAAAAEITAGGPAPASG